MIFLHLIYFINKKLIKYILNVYLEEYFPTKQIKIIRYLLGVIDVEPGKIVFYGFYDANDISLGCYQKSS